MYTLEETKKFIDVCREQLINLGHKEIKDKNYKVYFEPEVSDILGICIKKRNDNNNYTLKFNKNFFLIGENNCIKDTIMHEVIHSLNDCMTHTGKWLDVAKEVNSTYNYNVTEEYNVFKYNEILEKQETLIEINEIAERKKWIIYCPECGAETYKYRRCKTLYDIYYSNYGISKHRCKCGNNHFIVLGEPLFDSL